MDYLKMKTILIVGYGVVGHNLYQELLPLQPDIYDKYKTEFNTKKDIKYDFCFICVDTPRTGESSCEISQIQNVLQENEADIYVIKSTVLPGTTEKLSAESGKRIVFSPEYYGGTQHCNNFNFNFTILGGEKGVCCCIVQLLQYIYDGRHKFYMVDSKTAELAKYMENCWLATKVVFCNQFNLMCEQLGIDYETLRELFVADPRVNESHTFVYKDTPYYNSHCLNKDVPALAEFMDNDFLKYIVSINEKMKKG